MIRSCMSSTSKSKRGVRSAERGAALMAALLCLGLAARAWAARAERDPMTMRVVAVNPSTDKTKTVPVRIDLPQEIRPEDIVDKGELQMEYDEEKALYYMFKPDVALAPKQTKVFEVVVKDVWFIPEADLESLRGYTKLVLKRLEKSQYYASAKQMADSITMRLDEVSALQTDETISRKSRIGGYRRNLQTIESIKQDLARMEKLLSFAGGPPIPQMLEESPLKSDAPSTATTWLVIFLIVVFMGLLAGQFFFTWQRRLKSSAEPGESSAAFPEPPASRASDGAGTASTTPSGMERPSP